MGSVPELALKRLLQSLFLSHNMTVPSPLVESGTIMRFGCLFLAVLGFWLIPGFVTHISEADCFPGVALVPGKTKDGDAVSQIGFQASAAQRPPEATSMDIVLTPAQAYAAEILAYLVQITLGIAGDPEYREQWRNLGLDEPLDFQNVVATMTEPERNALDLMVLDPNILDLTTVLYFYDKNLSLYEGDYGVTSIYPASEFVAIRLLLLKKIHSKEKVRLSALIARKDLLCSPAVKPTQQDLHAMNLTAQELIFLKEIIQSKPYLFHYLKSPFLVKTLWGAGAVAEDDFVRDKISQASYRGYSCRHLQGSDRPGAVKICFLPSMTDEFVHGLSNNHRVSDGFQPTEFLLDMARKLAGEIEAATKKCMKEAFFSLGSSRVAMGRSQWEAICTRIVGKYLGFCIADQRPFVVYPENAAQTVQDICPQADFCVIILGKNVYKSIFFDPKSDSYPAVNRVYVDIMDIKHSSVEEDVETLARFICKRVTERLLADRMREGVLQ